jgi:hypothetical protein
MYLHPDILKGEWTKDDDRTLEDKFGQYGSSWTTIALFLPGRSEVQIKNRWAKLFRARKKTAAQGRKQRTPKTPFPPITELCPQTRSWPMQGCMTFQFGDFGWV